MKKKIFLAVLVLIIISGSINFCITSLNNRTAAETAFPANYQQRVIGDLHIIEINTAWLHSDEVIAAYEERGYKYKDTFAKEAHFGGDSLGSQTWVVLTKHISENGTPQYFELK